MRNWRLAVSAALSALVLHGCGGGGGGGSTTPPVVLPTPTPAPTPAPTPTPTPSPTYAEATDFSANRDYLGWGVQFVRTYTAPPFGSPAGTAGTSVLTTDLAPETRAAGFIYTAATKIYVARWFTEDKSFGPVTSFLFQGLIPTDTAPDFVRSHFRVHPTIADYTRYLGFTSWSSFEGDPSNSVNNSVIRSYYSIFGTTTIPSDLPTSGSHQYSLQSGRITGGYSGYVIGGVDDLLITVNWGTGAITGTLTLQPEPSAPAGTQALVMNFSGTINMGSSRLSGSITGPFAGTFSGAVFGPQGRELGMAMTLTNGSGGRIAAVAGGRRP